MTPYTTKVAIEEFYKKSIKPEVDKGLLAEQVEINLQEIIENAIDPMKITVTIDTSNRVNVYAINDNIAYIIVRRKGNSNFNIIKLNITNLNNITYEVKSFSSDYINPNTYYNAYTWIDENGNCNMIDTSQSSAKNGYHFVFDFDAGTFTYTALPTAMVGYSNEDFKVITTKAGIAYIMCRSYQSSYTRIDCIAQCKNGVITIASNSSAQVASDIQTNSLFAVGNNGCIFAFLDSNRVINIYYYDENLTLKTVTTDISGYTIYGASALGICENSVQALIYAASNSSINVGTLAHVWIENGEIQYKVLNSAYSNIKNVSYLKEINGVTYIILENYIGVLQNENIIINGFANSVICNNINYATYRYKNSIYLEINLEYTNIFTLKYKNNKTVNVANSIKKYDNSYVIKYNSGINLPKTVYTLHSFPEIETSDFDVYNVNIEMLFSSEET